MVGYSLRLPRKGAASLKIELEPLLVLIGFCPVYSELFTWSFLTKTFAILPENIIEYQI